MLYSIYIYTYIYIYLYVKSICDLRTAAISLFECSSVWLRSNEDLEVTRVSMAYHLWLPFSINRVLK